MNPPNQLSTLAEQRVATFPADAPTFPPFSVGPAAVPFEFVEEIRRDGFYERHGKRLFDVIGAGILLLLTAPILLLAMLAIKLDTPGPVLFRSTRCGKGGRPFFFYKLRSMYNGSHSQRNALMHLNEMDGPVFKLAHDPRITRVGRILRRTSVDELPQLWNVLRGDMSLIGPRPPIPEEVAQYSGFEARRLSVKPGLTCLWQVSGRSTLGFDEWMRLDIQYIRQRSFPLDLKILLQTIPAVLSCRGAY
jgi:lipopolysaccharide/colanic/teichoic acid biosynthesis glycosyltransferase